MKRLMNIGLFLGGLFLMLGASAQGTQSDSGSRKKSSVTQPNGVSSTTTDNSKNKTKTPARKVKTKTTTSPNGSTTTKTKSKPTKKKDVSKTN